MTTREWKPGELGEGRSSSYEPCLLKHHSLGGRAINLQRCLLPDHTSALSVVIDRAPLLAVSHRQFFIERGAHQLLYSTCRLEEEQEEEGTRECRPWPHRQAQEAPGRSR